MENKNIVEISQFKLAKGVTKEDFLREANLVQEKFLERQQGYINRELLKDEEGQWMDILHWESLNDALKASETLLKEPSAQSFIEKMNPTSVKIFHLTHVKIW